jgi:hypothetical protein
MPPERFSDVKLEIGHVLFIDIVGYSKLLITEQCERLQTLREIDDIPAVRKLRIEVVLIPWLVLTTFLVILLIYLGVING